MQRAPRPIRWASWRTCSRAWRSTASRPATAKAAAPPPERAGPKKPVWTSEEPRAAREKPAAATRPPTTRKVEVASPAPATGPEMEDDIDEPAVAARPSSRGSMRGAGVLAALVVVVVAAVGGYAIWLNRAELAGMFATGGGKVAMVDDKAAVATPAGQTQQAAAQSPAKPDTTSAAAPAGQSDGTQAAMADTAASQQSGPPRKFTERLNADGTETDTGPAGNQPTIGEGTSVAAATQTADAGPTAAQNPTDAKPDVPVAQRAIFYEERTQRFAGLGGAGNDRVVVGEGIAGQ